MKTKMRRTALIVSAMVGCGLFILSCNPEDGTGPESGSISVTVPNCSESFTVGQAASVSWTEDNLVNINRLTVSFSNDNGKNWTSLGTVNPGVKSFSFTPVVAHVGSLCLIKVASSGGSVSDVSDAVFSVVPANVKRLAGCATTTEPIELVYPRDGDTLHVGDIVEVKFAYTAAFNYNQAVVKISGIYAPTDLNAKPIDLPARTFLWTVTSSIRSGTTDIDVLGENFLDVRDYNNNIVSKPVRIIIEN